ncbi:MAG: hypothetical protein VKJ64_17820 [Leptolyngbyaceae bacterium]|nr:hypothetical protein [Leptolyngbyaceae bacterium]
MSAIASSTVIRAFISLLDEGAIAPIAHHIHRFQAELWLELLGIKLGIAIAPRQ